MAGAASKAAASEIGKAMRPVIRGSDGMWRYPLGSERTDGVLVHIVGASFPSNGCGAGEPIAQSARLAAKSAKIAR
jgi:hypothetical protein